MEKVEKQMQMKKQQQQQQQQKQQQATYNQISKGNHLTKKKLTKVTVAFGKL